MTELSICNFYLIRSESELPKKNLSPLSHINLANFLSCAKAINQKAKVLYTRMCLAVCNVSRVPKLLQEHTMFRHASSNHLWNLTEWQPKAVLNYFPILLWVLLQKKYLYTCKNIAKKPNLKEFYLSFFLVISKLKLWQTILQWDHTNQGHPD